MNEKELRELGVPLRHHDEPGQRDGQEHRDRQGEVPSAPVTQVPRHEHVNDQRPADEHEGHDALAQHGKSERRRGQYHPPALWRRSRVARSRPHEREQRGHHEEAEAAVEDVELSDDGEIRIDRQHGRCRDRHRATPIEMARERIGQRDAEKRERAGPEPRRPLLDAKGRVRGGRRPVLQRRLLEVLQVVQAGRNPVT